MMLSLVSCVSARGQGVDLMGLVVLVDTENAIFDQTSLVLAAPNLGMMDTSNAT